jgi:predicted dinucleotide-binding enzyme
VNIAILGGTGKEGAGLAMRWAQAGHSIVIGSRPSITTSAPASRQVRADGSRSALTAISCPSTTRLTSETSTAWRSGPKVLSQRNKRASVPESATSLTTA